MLLFDSLCFSRRREFIYINSIKGRFSLCGGESRMCRERFFSHSLDSSPMFGDRHRTVSLCAPARCVCVGERKSCGEQPDAAIAADKDWCLCVESRIQIHQLNMLDQLLFTLEI